MFGSFRAGGIAAAIAMVGATVVGAGPTQAWELQAAPQSLIPHQITATPTVAGQTVAGPFASESPQAAVSAQTETPVDLPLGEEAVSLAVPVIAVQTTPAEPATPPERLTLAELVAAHRSTGIPNRERECLAGAIYFESKGEPLSGQLAVGQVVANRAKSGRFPKSWCGVVFQRSQFSFVRGGNLPPIPRSSAHWKTAVAIAHIVANDLSDAVAPRSLFFHARYVSPNWKRMSRVAAVGNHIFYR